MGMPMQVCTPEEIADILLQPTKDKIAAHKALLVAGEITVEEYISFMSLLKLEMELKTVLLEAIRDSGRVYNEKLELLNAIFPWNIR